MARSNWDLFFLRAGFVVLVAAIAVFFRPFGFDFKTSALIGAFGALAGIPLELRLRHARVASLVGACLGLAVGGVFGLFFILPINTGDFLSSGTALFLRLSVPLVCGFTGLLVGLAKSDLTNEILPRVGRFRLLNQQGGHPQAPKLLDTSVLIDGRIADIVESGFLDGRLVIPQFVLHELQSIADSADSARRNRGRRGLDIVSRLQKMTQVTVEISPADYPAIREVDLKLIEAAKSRRAQVVTNDFNLNKLAQVQGIGVLNINELAGALRPVVLPGESMRVFILKEGKEHGQGIAYLEDGTMVVVENARRQVSKTVDAIVTSVLQTTAGKMIFTKLDDRAHPISEPRSAVAGSTSA